MKKPGLVYIGKGTLWMRGNVPTPDRDLTPDEVELYGGADELLGSGLYALPKEESENGEGEVIDDGSIK